MAESETSKPPTDSRPARISGGVSGGSIVREDCWTEEATAVLIEAWGKRHIRSNRRNLRQNDWLEISDAVNDREDGEKVRMSDVQCKNRIDTLKKRYKVEKARSAPSTWQFFRRMDYLVGPGTRGKKSAGPSSNFTSRKRPSRFTVIPCHNRNPNSSSSAIPKRTSGGSSSRFDSFDSSGSESSSGVRVNGKRPASAVGGAGVGRKRRRVELNSPPQETPFSELAKAILKFGEIYERTESSKREQLVELEKQRMEFTMDLEVQRMKLLTEAHVEVEKVLRSKNASNSGVRKKVPS